MITGEENIINEEIKRARGLKTEGQLVEKHNCSPGHLFENESVIIMENVAEKTEEKLERHGIKPVLDMKMTTASQISAIVAGNDFRMSVNTLNE
jgi:hypothetical protein